MTDGASLAELVELLSQLTVFQSLSFERFLKKMVQLLNNIIPVDSCLIYVYDKATQTLTLSGSKASHKKLMGNLTMQQGEGITGWVAEHGKSVVIEKGAYKDKRFKVFTELPEDSFEAFLSVPVTNKTGVLGVVNLQNKEPRAFSKQEIKLLESVVKIIAAGFEQVLLGKQVDTLTGKLEERKLVERAKGLIMKKEKLTEKKAYDMLRNEAMRKRKSMREIAEAVVLLYG
jgi:signal transduction protein with GAF and PtsI domain